MPRADRGASSSLPSSLQLAEIVDVDRADVGEQENKYREADRRFGGGNGQDEEHENLPRHVVQEIRKRDEVQIDSEQHQIDGHLQNDHVIEVADDATHGDGL